jgi:septal ring factor EnvC (AmiA/AmiB activator)
VGDQARVRLDGSSLRPSGMTTKTKAIIALAFGGICVALGLIYGVSGQMLSSISERGEMIARWEKELVKDTQEIEALMAKLDKLGDKPDATPEEREQFGYGVSRVEQMTSHLKHSRDMIEDQRAHRKQQILVTAGFCVVGVLSMLGGLVLLRRVPR